MADKRLVVRGNAALCERELKVEHKKRSNKKKKRCDFELFTRFDVNKTNKRKRRLCQYLRFFWGNKKKRYTREKGKQKKRKHWKTKTQRGWRYWNTHYPVKQRFWSENSKGSSHHYTITFKKRHEFKKKKNLSLKCVKKKKKRKCYERVSKTHLGRSKKKKAGMSFSLFLLTCFKKKQLQEESCISEPDARSVIYW